MPFSKAYSLDKEQWIEIFEYKIKLAVEESGFGYKCERYELRRANITKAILNELNNAHVVIADLTGKNPNVLWELGVRHTLSKRTILIAQDKKFLPSDLKDYPIILYKYKQTPADVDKFKREIKDKLEDIEANPENLDSPVADFLQLRNIVLLAYEKKANLKKLSALISETSFNIRTIDYLMGIVKSNKQARKAGKGVEFPSARFSHSCLDLLLSSSYVMLSKEIQLTIRNMSTMVVGLNNWLAGWANERLEKQTEGKLEQWLPKEKEEWIKNFRMLSEFRTVYADENYIEPAAPIICLAKQEHEQY